jgi:hypothetical protein
METVTLRDLRQNWPEVEKRLVGGRWKISCIWIF